MWYLKQLLPLSYETKYIQDGRLIYCRWRMWFGRCFNIVEYERDFLIREWRLRVD